MTTEEKFKAVRMMPEYFRDKIFTATLALKAAEMSSPKSMELPGMLNPSEWAHCFEAAFDMYQTIVNDK